MESLFSSSSSASSASSPMASKPFSFGHSPMSSPSSTSTPTWVFTPTWPSSSSSSITPKFGFAQPKLEPPRTFPLFKPSPTLTTSDFNAGFSPKELQWPDSFRKSSTTTTGPNSDHWGGGGGFLAPPKLFDTSSSTPIFATPDFVSKKSTQNSTFRRFGPEVPQSNLFNPPPSTKLFTPSNSTFLPQLVSTNNASQTNHPFAIPLIYTSNGGRFPIPLSYTINGSQENPSFGIPLISTTNGSQTNYQFAIPLISSCCNIGSKKNSSLANPFLPQPADERDPSPTQKRKIPQSVILFIMISLFFTIFLSFYGKLLCFM